MARRKWTYKHELVEQFVCVSGMNPTQFAKQHGFSKNAVLEQLYRGYCAWPKRQTKTGHTSHPLYSVWSGMWTRCTNENEPAWPHYGGRGIMVCGRWVKFENFLADMGERPTAQHSLDRIDTNGNYEPGNCRWASDSLQTHNRRELKRAGMYRGVHECRPGVWRATGVRNGKRVHLGYYRNPHRAAIAFNRHAIRTYGSAANLNVIKRRNYDGSKA